MSLSLALANHIYITDVNKLKTTKGKQRIRIVSASLCCLPFLQSLRSDTFNQTTEYFLVTAKRNVLSAPFKDRAEANCCKKTQ